jgi:hypothetical protein
MTQTLPAVLLNGNNAEVLHYLQPLSCHGDNIESLLSYLSRHPDVHRFCPDAGNYRYFLWYTGDTVFAYGVGMSDVCLRFTDTETALAAEHARASWCFDGASWFSFRYDCEQLEDLAGLAYRQANS